MRFIPFFLVAIVLVGCNGNSASNNNSDTKQPTIVLTFDDVFVENWHSASSELLNRGVTATFFVSDYGNPNKVYNTRLEPKQSLLKDLEQKGFEIAQHSYNHENSKDYIEKHGIDKWFKNEVSRSTCYMLEDGFNLFSYAYPHSNSNTDKSDALLFNHFDSIRLYPPKGSDISTGINGKNQKIFMSTPIDEQKTSLNNIKLLVDRVINTDSIVILAAHDISNYSDNHLYIKTEQLLDLVDYALQKGVKFTNFKDIVGNKKLEYSDFGCSELEEDI
ncbi:polysaccharide deacetylase family protein [Vibrio sp. STUT-A16]|uniref:polysaccharide deacetylase family protein n=1 Tax=Vibrio TaxID=662 RepID=UPI00222E3CBD|nr:polysaccharide deacetylase family protein [Vibrio sp. STUT-A16]BDR19581.1 chitooligosaccharide deacetylase [Vibrio sp. STUT-A16]